MFTESDYSANEGDGTLQVCVVRDRPIADNFTAVVTVQEQMPPDAIGM